MKRGLEVQVYAKQGFHVALLCLFATICHLPRSKLQKNMPSTLSILLKIGNQNLDDRQNRRFVLTQHVFNIEYETHTKKVARKAMVPATQNVVVCYGNFDARGQDSDYPISQYQSTPHPTLQPAAVL